MAGDDDADHHQDQLARLPDDVLAEILRRVPPRWLAAVRRVCKAWRDAVDSRRLLRADLLPLSLAGIFIHYEKHKFPEYLARPSMAGSRAVTTDLSFLPSETPILQCDYWQTGYASDYNIEDHCNGLLLLSSNCVVNPATGRWYSLPTCPSQDVLGGVGVFQNPRLVYDPMVSPYYKVFSIPTLDKTDTSMNESVDEWPPYVCKMYVFSSKSHCWEEKDFVRDGDAVGTVGEMQEGYSECRAVYFRGALYVHCETDYLMRVSLSSNTYITIKPPPMDLKVKGGMHTSIERSKNGVYFWALHRYWLRVWILTESSGQMEWMLKHDKELKPVQARRPSVHSPWILEDINYKLFRSSHSPQHKDIPPTGEIFEWNSDDDDGVENRDMVEHCNLEDNPLYLGDIEILGFHPYKEIVFLSSSTLTGLPYHLNGSKIEVLGDIHPKEYYFFQVLRNEGAGLRSFPYTPCWIEEF